MKVTMVNDLHKSLRYAPFKFENGHDAHTTIWIDRGQCWIDPR